MLISCGKNTEFTQLKKDWEQLENGKKSSAVPKTDSVIAANQLPDSLTQINQSTPTGNKRQQLVNFAKESLGTPYKFACSDPEQGFDCSGFLYFVYHHFGYDVPRSSKDYEFFGEEISANDAKIGDLVLFSPTENDASGNRVGHIGILINQNGMKSDFIHASSGKANGVTISSLGSDHYTKRFVKFIKIME